MSPQHEQLLDILSDRRVHCAVEIVERMHIVDYRKRLSELRKKGYSLISRPCRGACGRKHTSGVHLWEWSAGTLF